jgi:hypothetical protein
MTILGNTWRILQLSRPTLDTIQELARYWGKDYDWRKYEAKLNDLPQFMTEIDGLDIHFIHVRSKHEKCIAQSQAAKSELLRMLVYRLPINNRGRRLQLGRRPAGLPEADCDRPRP